MNIIVCIIIICKVVFSCKQAEKKQMHLDIKTEYLVDKKDISDLINYCMNSKAKIFGNCDYVWDRDPIFYFTEYDSLQISKLDLIFTKKDLNFIFKQALINPKLTLDSKIIPKDKLVHLNIEKALSPKREIRKEYFDITRAKYRQICTLSIPLFYEDKNTAIVKIGYSCGALCGEGGIYIYKKAKNGNWTLIKLISDWVS